MSLNFITKLLVLLLLPLLFTAVSCNKPTEPPPPENYALEIITADASCTEVWIDVKSPNTLLPQIFTLTENGEEKGSVTINKADTTIVIENLLPKKSYKYQLKNTEHKSNETEITTLDTTSHNFTWQTFEFGQHSSSALYDVAIIDENNIWAVGEIYTTDSYTYDSLGNWIDPYNAIHWNGSVWELVRIYYNYNGSKQWSPIRTILAFSDSDIWFGAGIHWNGMAFQTKPMNITFPYQINKMWGISSSDFYIVGNSGSIAHWNGSSWKKIESPIGTSGTTLQIQDIWGDFNKGTQEWEILAVAANKFLNEGSTVLKIEKTQAKEINKTGLPWSLSSIWFQSSKNYFIGGDGLFSTKKTNNDWRKLASFPSFYKDRIRGVGLNDIVVSGSNGLLSHYNGYTWHHYQNNELPYFAGRLLSVELKNNIIAAIGWKDQSSIIILGRR